MGLGDQTLVLELSHKHRYPLSSPPRALHGNFKAPINRLRKVLTSAAMQVSTFADPETTETDYIGVKVKKMRLARRISRSLPVHVTKLDNQCLIPGTHTPEGEKQLLTE